jgi:hypothetical protein
MDQEWFVFETAGTLVVGWEGGPLQQTTTAETGDRAKGKDDTRLSGEHDRDRDDSEMSSEDDLPTVTSKAKTKTTDALDLAGYDRPRTTTTGIEIAAALTTGTVCALLYSKLCWGIRMNVIQNCPECVAYLFWLYKLYTGDLSKFPLVSSEIMVRVNLRLMPKHSLITSSHFCLLPYFIYAVIKDFESL